MTTAMTTAIAIECTCGRRGHISARLAGRKVRCTGCGQPVRVPTASGAIAAVTITPPSSAPSDARLELAAAPPSDRGLELMPEVTRTFHDPASITRQRRAPAAVADEAPRARRASSGQRRDADWERHLRAIAIWPMISGVLGVAAVCIGALVMSASQMPPGFVAPLVVGVCAVSAVEVAYGYFLWCYGAIARILHLVFAGAATALCMISLITTPGVPLKLLALLQLAWPAAIFAVLMDPRAAAICTSSYRTLVARTPRVSVAWWTSPFFYLPILLTGLCALPIIVMIVGVGLRL